MQWSTGSEQPGPDLLAAHGEPLHLQVRTGQLGTSGLLLDGRLQDVAPVREEPVVAVLGGLGARGCAHPAHQLRVLEHLDHPGRHRVGVSGRDQEAVLALSDLLPRAVLDVVADDRTAVTEALQGGERVALEQAGHQEGAGAPQRVPRVRVVPLQGDRAAQVQAVDHPLDAVGPAAATVDLQAGVRQLRDHVLEGLDRVAEPLLALQACHDTHQTGVALDHVGLGRQVDGVGHDEHVRGVSAQLGEVLALTFGEGHERVEVVGELDHPLVDRAGPGVPPTLTTDMDVVHQVDQVHVRRLHRGDVRHHEPRVQEHEGVLAAGQVAQPAPVPGRRTPIAPDDLAVTRDPGEVVRPGRRLLEHERRDADEGGAVGTLVVVHDAAVTEAVGASPRTSVGQRRLPHQLGAEVGRLLAGGLLSRPVGVAVVLEDVEQVDPVAEQLALPEGLPPPGEVVRRADGEHVGVRTVCGEDAAAHQQRSRLPAVVGVHVDGDREVPAGGKLSSVHQFLSTSSAATPAGWPGCDHIGRATLLRVAPARTEPDRALLPTAGEQVRCDGAHGLRGVPAPPLHAYAREVLINTPSGTRTSGTGTKGMTFDGPNRGSGRWSCRRCSFRRAARGRSRDRGRRR